MSSSRGRKRNDKDKEKEVEEEGEKEQEKVDDAQAGGRKRRADAISAPDTSANYCPIDANDICVLEKDAKINIYQGPVATPSIELTEELTPDMFIFTRPIGSASHQKISFCLSRKEGKEGQILRFAISQPIKILFQPTQFPEELMGEKSNLRRYGDDAFLSPLVKNQIDL